MTSMTRLRRWLRQAGCAHHPHTAGDGILWWCCRCGKDLAGHPTARTDRCAYEAGCAPPVVTE